MAFTYNSDLSTDRDKLRFLISDTDSSNPIYQDAELDGVLNMEANLYRAAALALRARASSFIEKAIRYSVGGGGREGLTVDRTRIIANFERMIASYEARASSTPDEFFDRLDFNIDVFGNDLSHYQGDNRDFGIGSFGF